MTQVELPMGWQWKSIGEVCRVIPGFAFKSKDWTDTGIPVIKIKNIQADCSVDTSTCDYIPSEIFTEKLNKFVARKGDILIAMTGATAGKIGRLLANESFLINQRVAKLEPETIDKDFFWGVVSGRHYQELFFNLADGAAQPNMSGKQIEGVRIPVPPPQTQEKISLIIGSYDDLIENNTRRINILEEMARRLYEEWFVQFRFPGHEGVEFTDSSLGLTPVGWTFRCLQDVITLQRGFDLPVQHRIAGSVPIISATGIGGSHIEAKVKGPGVVTGRSGSIGTVMYVHDDHWPLNTTLWGANYPLGSTLFAYYVLSSIDLKGFNVGAAVPTLNRNDIHGLPVIIPPKEIVQGFEEVAGPLHNLTEKLRRKNTNLLAQRDLLLPKLISGEIDVSDIPTPT